MKIRERLILGFIGTFLLLGFVSYTSKKANYEIRRSALIVSEILKQEVKGASDMLLALQATQIAMHEILETQDIKTVTQRTVNSKIDNEQIKKLKYYFAPAEKSFLLSKKAILSGIKMYKDIGEFETAKQWQKKLELLNQLEKELLIYKSWMNEVNQLYTRDGLKGYNFLKLSFKKQYQTKILPLLNDYKTGREQELVTQSKKVIEVTNAAEQRIIIASIFTLVAATVTGILISRSILKPLNKLKVAAEKVGKGGTNIRVDIKSKDEVEILANAFNQMMDDLSKTTVAKSYLDQIINSMTDTLIVINSHATIVRINDATIKLLGYAEDELFGQGLSHVLTPEFYQILEKNTIIRGAIADTETVYITKEGRQIPVFFSASVIDRKSVV